MTMIQVTQTGGRPFIFDATSIRSIGEVDYQQQQIIAETGVHVEVGTTTIYATLVNGLQVITGVQETPEQVMKASIDARFNVSAQVGPVLAADYPATVASLARREKLRAEAEAIEAENVVQQGTYIVPMDHPDDRVIGFLVDGEQGEYIVDIPDENEEAPVTVDMSVPAEVNLPPVYSKEFQEGARNLLKALDRVERDVLIDKCPCLAHTALREARDAEKAEMLRKSYGG